MLTPEAINADTARIRALTSAPFGLNLLLFVTDEALLNAEVFGAFVWSVSPGPKRSNNYGEGNAP